MHLLPSVLIVKQPLKAVTSVKVTSVLVAEVYRSAPAFEQYEKCPAGVGTGILRNNGQWKAVLLVKQAAGPEPALALSLTTVRDTVEKSIIREQWQWQALPGCRQSKEMLRKPPDTGASKAKTTDWLTGHADLNHHLICMKVSDYGLCPFCQEEEESSVHFSEMNCNYEYPEG